jgi:hypothetical protein
MTSTAGVTAAAAPTAVAAVIPKLQHHFTVVLALSAPTRQAACAEESQLL